MVANISDFFSGRFCPWKSHHMKHLKTFLDQISGSFFKRIKDLQIQESTLNLRFSQIHDYYPFDQHEQFFQMFARLLEYSDDFSKDNDRTIILQI